MAEKCLLTIESLIQFFEEQKFEVFSVKQHGYRLNVQVPASFEVIEHEDDAHRNMMRVKIKIFHTGLNRNGSYVSEESATKAMSSIKNRPILAYIHQLDDGTWDFEGHAIDIVEHEDGTKETVYLESQVGSFSEEEPFFEYDEEQDKTYICAYGWISKTYTKAAEIIERKQGTKNSVELSIDELVYNAKEKYLELVDFYVDASTLLGCKKDGTPIGEGMLGSRADIATFTEKPVSVLNDTNEKIIETLEKLNETLMKFEINTNQKGGQAQVGKFEELLTLYNLTSDDITFDYENMTDDELEAKFIEIFGETQTENPEASAVEPEIETPKTFENPEEPTGLENPEEPKEPEAQFMQKVFEISHEDIRCALYNLLIPYEEEDNECYWILGVYDDYFAYENWNGGMIYGQKYAKDGDNVVFSGERYKLFRELLTESEKMELDNMRSNYSAIQTELQRYQAMEEEEKKQALFTSPDYNTIIETEEFISLKEEMGQYSYDDLVQKLDAMLLSYAKSGNLSFSAQEPELQKPVIAKKQITVPSTKKKNSRYGTLKFN